MVSDHLVSGLASSLLLSAVVSILKPGGSELLQVHLLYRINSNVQHHKSIQGCALD